MQRPIALLSLGILVSLTFVLVSCFSGVTPEVPRETRPLSYYQDLWKEVFRAYQTGSTDFPQKGHYDFSVNLLADGDRDRLHDLVPLGIDSTFSDMSFHLSGDYDFSDRTKPGLSGTFRMYLNKRDFGIGDIDVDFTIYPDGNISYRLNNVDTKALDFLRIDAITQEKFLTIARVSSGAEVTNTGVTTVSTNASQVVREVFETVLAKSQDSPLYKNSQEQEEKIIAAFLDHRVIDVFSGSTSGEMNTFEYRLNPEHTVAFLNDTAQILAGNNEKKRFDGDATLFKNIFLSGMMEVKAKRILLTDFVLALPLNTRTSTGGTAMDVLDIHSRLRIPDPHTFHIDYTAQIAVRSAPTNRLQIRLQGSIQK